MIPKFFWGAFFCLFILMIPVGAFVYLTKKGDKLQAVKEAEREFYYDKMGRTIEIIKIRDCEYVLWYGDRANDLEHYAGCLNEKHGSTSKVAE